MSRAKDDSFSGRRVTVMGLGRFGGGLGVARWLAGKGAVVTVSDQACQEDLANSVAALETVDVALHLGGHEARDFDRCDLVVVNPAVPLNSPYLDIARGAGAELTTGINLFLARCKAPVVGITGSAGKSTTTAMTGAILRRRMPAHVGGNLGGSLLESLPDIAADHVVVLELSSFQLAHLPLLRRSPHVAVVTNIHPNHLDRHGSMAEYILAKKNIFRYQGGGDVLIYNRDDAETASWPAQAPGLTDSFGADDPPFDLKVPGQHNQANAGAAWSVARRFGVHRAVAAEALAEFAGLAHRLQLVARRDGVKYFNDSKSTTPAATIVALEAFGPKTAVVIVGGYDKKTDFDGLCAVLARRARGVIATGHTGEAIARGVESRRADASIPIVVRAPQFADAVRAGRDMVRRGDVLLLSPACASFDQFRNYEHRGETFGRLVCED